MSHRLTQDTLINRFEHPGLIHSMYLELNGYDLSISEIVGLVTDQMCAWNWTEGMVHMRLASVPAGLLVGIVATSWWFQRCSMSIKKTGMKMPHGLFISHGLKPSHR